jgi:Outer membrane protein beta-barrel domain
MTIKSYLISLILALPFIAFSQTKKVKKYAIGLSYEANYGYRQLSFSGVNQEVADRRNAEEIADLGLATGINFRYQINEKIALETGALYASIGFKTPQKDLIWASNAPNLPNKSKSALAYKGLIFPLKMNYNFKIGKLNAYATAGTSLNYLLVQRTTTTTYFEDGSSVNNASDLRIGFNHFSWSIIAGFGVNYALSNRFMVNIEPTYRQGITSILSDTNSKEYSYTLGLNARVFYTF